MINRLPSWFRQDVPDAKIFKTLSNLSGLKVNTVCQQAKCPNLTRCFKQDKLTFLILGNTCTRNCSFCNVDKAKGADLAIDHEEPRRLSRTVDALGLKYVVLTSVTRDDLPDGGAGQFAKAIGSIRNAGSGIKVEVLIPDFSGSLTSLRQVLSAGPDVLAHNLETVRRLYPLIRPQADYGRSLELLSAVKDTCPDMPTKSSLMLGMGECRQEVEGAMRDLRDSRCDILTLGQYLAPSARHYPVKEFISPEKFREYEVLGRVLGFKAVLSGPLVRSSYQAEEVYKSLFREVFDA